MDDSKLCGREGHYSRPLRKTSDEARQPRCSARRHRQGSVLDRRHQARSNRLLAPLAFVSPRIVAAIVDGTAPADLTVTGLAKALPYSWAEQEKSLGLPQ